MAECPGQWKRAVRDFASLGGSLPTIRNSREDIAAGRSVFIAEASRYTAAHYSFVMSKNV